MTDQTRDGSGASGGTDDPRGRRALVALGSNLGDRLGYLSGALGSFDGVVAASDVYETKPVGGPEQGPYLNMVLLLHTSASARQLLEQCHAAELAAGRVRRVRWGPRTLDADVLWIDGEQVDDPDLVVPHPRMYERDFVLVPLGDVAPDLLPAGYSPVDADGVVRIGPLPYGAGLPASEPRPDDRCARSG